MSSYRTVLLQMANASALTPLIQPIVFELEGFYVPPGYGALLFFLVLLNYAVVLFGNGVVMLVTILDQTLHRPMFVMICHLVVCDLLGSTAVLPCLMGQFLMGQKRIAYIAGIAQGFCVHTYGVAVQTLLGAMAYDRYVAVCEPLRYHTIMTPARLHACCTVAWSTAVVCITVLFGLHANTPLCGNVIQHVYCTNRGILSLACKSTPANNIYGLSMSWCISSGVFVIIAFTYIKILHSSIKHGRSDFTVRSKAFQTCATHLVVYVLFEISSTIIILTYRFPSASANIKKFLSILFIVVPPALNPIIYGLISRELRTSIIKYFSRKLTVK
ncbi:olfactory receptor 52E4-like [Cynoglossus semilaevis]|uniref:olfactory receptor 52E4-like n=1 Tax=Cynoglossus semilaevis TaxID=244447 RepID=UPI0007DC87B2|nr:olfactory receptor 52E4-like [Cynoglossus semilaevis]